MNSELQIVARQLETAYRPEDVFGDLQGLKEEKIANLKKLYHQLAKVTHPDAYSSSEDQTLAQEAFSRLSGWFTLAEEKIKTGAYGSHAAASHAATIRLQSVKYTYCLSNDFAEGLVYNHYDGICEPEGAAIPVTLKLVRNPPNNDLAENEALILRLLSRGKEADQFGAYLPRLVETFLYEENGVSRMANVLESGDRWYSLEAVRQVYPDGIDAKDMAWMFRRMLVALGFAHLNGVIHGAVLPSHILIQPDQHGLLLTEWSYALHEPERNAAYIQAIDLGHANWYPAEVHQKEIPLPGTDIGMAAKCMIFLLGGDPITNTFPAGVPDRIRAFLKGCNLPGKLARPQDAWGLLQEFDVLIERLWGKRKFHPFYMA